MIKTTYQTPELRDANDNIIQEGTFGKHSAFSNSTNDGAFDYILNDLEALHDNINGSRIYVANKAALPATGDLSAMYIAEDTGKWYLWDGTKYIETDNARKIADEAIAARDAAKASQTAAKTSEQNAKTSETNAASSKTAAATSATNAANSATAAAASETAAKAYMDNAKNYSENVNVFLPGVSSDGVLSWTNKAGLPNPASVNIKGAKGDQGLQGATGAAATIRIGSVTTGAAGSNASVTNSGTTSDVVLNFTLPRGKDGTGGGGGTVTVDDELSDTSTNPVQNKVVKMNLDALTNGLGAVSNQIPTKVSTLENDAGYLTQHQSLDNYAKTDSANVWKGQQTFTKIVFNAEYYASSWLRGTSDTPDHSIMHYIATGAFTLNLSRIVANLGVSKSTVFTAYIESSADYPLSITNAGTLKYIGAASDLAITSAGLLLNILVTRDDAKPVVSIVQASKLS